MKKKHSDLFAEYKTKYNDVMLTLKLIKEGKLDCNAIERSYNLRLEENVILELKARNEAFEEKLEKLYSKGITVL